MFYWACYITYGLKATSKIYLAANMLIMNSSASHWHVQHMYFKMIVQKPFNKKQQK